MDISNAYRGPGSLPGPRPSEGRKTTLVANRLLRGSRIGRFSEAGLALALFVGRRLCVRGTRFRRLECARSFGPYRSTRHGSRPLRLLVLAGHRRAGRDVVVVVRNFPSRPRIGRDYPLNLSILLSGGEETNQDSPSNGE